MCIRDSYYTDQGLHGFANWYTVQAQEERDHALLFMKYLQNNDEKVTFEAVAKPDKVFADLKMCIRDSDQEGHGELFCRFGNLIELSLIHI